MQLIKCSLGIKPIDALVVVRNPEIKKCEMYKKPLKKRFTKYAINKVLNTDKKENNELTNAKHHQDNIPYVGKVTDKIG